MNFPLTATNSRIEDPLEFLPCSTILSLRKGQFIYGKDLASAGLYLVIDGTVKISSITAVGREVVIDVYQTDEFFGESSFVAGTDRREIAVALEDVKLMMWSIDEIETIASGRPKLAVALVQLFVQRSIDFGSRIESFSVDNIARRLGLALLRFSNRFGHKNDNGSVKMIPFTHALLSHYVGTSREIITHNMTIFRDKGFLEYSRRGIVLRGDGLRLWLATPLVKVIGAHTETRLTRVA